MIDFGIRSITYSINLEKINSKEYQNEVQEDIKYLKLAFEKKNVFVRTIRFNILPIRSTERLDKFLFLKKIKLLSEFTEKLGVRWFNICFDLIDLPNKNVKVICSIAYEIVKRFPNSFINCIVANDSQMNPFAAKECSQMILNVSKLSDNGYDNFRVGLSLNPNENTPFFPFSYATKDKTFSLATEITLGCINTIKKHREESLLDIENILKKNLKKFGLLLQNISDVISKEQDISYGGVDLSLAPYPDDDVSVIEVLHLLGLDDIGSNGTLFFTSYLTGIIKSVFIDGKVKPAGFNGVMYSLLEDHLMCEANDKKQLTIDQIIGYSTLCGCGLDMVPIPGNILIEELAAIILDVAVTSIKLKKPLGVRVLPVLNKEVNEFTSFDMDFLTNTRIMGMKNLSLSSAHFQINSFQVN